MSSRELEYYNKLISCPTCCSFGKVGTAALMATSRIFLLTPFLLRWYRWYFSWSIWVLPCSSGAKLLLLCPVLFHSRCFAHQLRKRNAHPPSLGTTAPLRDMPLWGEARWEERSASYWGKSILSSLSRIRGHVTGQCFVFHAYSFWCSIICIRASPKLDEVPVE